MQNIVETNKKFYDEYASDYDISRKGFYEIEKKRIQNDLSIFFQDQAFPKVVVDVGCGTGFYSINAVRMGAQEVHCIDISSGFLNTSKSQIEKEYPSVNVYTHQMDLNTFITEKTDICSRTDLFLMGGVLQHVPGYDAVLQNLIQRAPRANYYISSTVHPEINVPGLEKAFATIDYSLYRILESIPKIPKNPYPKVTLKVDPVLLNQLFYQAGLDVSLSRYTSFHTKLISKLQQKVSNIIPNMGRYFTLIACQN